MTGGRLSAAEIALGRVLAPPAHEAGPAPRPDPRRAAKRATAALLFPVSRLARLLVRPLRPRPLEGARMRSIAVVKADHLGDAIMSTPVFRSLRAWAPGARITAYVRGATAEFAGRLPHVDAVEVADVPWISPSSGAGANLRAAIGLARSLRERGFDLAVDLRYHNRMDSLVLSLCGARATLGFDAGGFGFGITHRAAWPAPGHEIERMASALRRFGIPVTDTAPEFPLLDRERAAAARLARGRGPLVAVHVGAGNAIKRWMPERFAWVGRELATRAKARVAVLAGPGEEEAGSSLVRALPRGSCMDLRGRLGLFEMGALIGQAAVFVGNDGGAAHVAAAVGTPSVVVFSGTNEAGEWAPAGPAVRAIERRVPCKPCASTTCPFDAACLRGVTVDSVLDAALGFLGTGGGRRR